MKTISYSHSSGQTTIFIQRNFPFQSFFKNEIKGKSIAVADENLAKVISVTHPGFFSSFDHLVTIPEGETAKSFEQYEKLIEALVGFGADRTTTLVAVGGGVTGDLTGFAGATFMRGLPVYQVPTTLLSQIDSSIGGKTGINLKAGKNLVGAFWQPKGILIDPEFLKSLPRREVYSALGEMLKYFILNSEEEFLQFHSVLMKETAESLLDARFDLLSDWIEKGVRYKVDIVEADEKELNVRALLNLGHTFGHAIEKFYGYEELRHGEAVSIGIWFAAWLSSEMGWLNQNQVNLIKECVLKLVPSEKPQKNWDEESILNYLLKDKKKEGVTLKYILPEKIGKCVIHPVQDLNWLSEKIKTFHQTELKW
ncbi:MAG: 3-dehydroquinate synthase [Bacteroidetes bacterium]|nr:3-dehydroquinate synthase [Bacteroidota bacterium]